MCDNFFHSAFGGSFLNHIFLVAAAPPVWPNAPASAISNPDPANLRDARVTPDGFAVNDWFTVNTPHPSVITDPAELVPEQTMPTIGDRLSDAGITWKWYSGGWNDAVAGHPDQLFQFHHQPFAYFQNYADGTAAKSAHLQDEENFLADIANGTLPSVCFVKPLGPDNEHPGYANLTRGEQHVADLVTAVKASQYWQDCAIIITYDENGGRWDHVPPPAIDQWGPGTRVPAVVISPLAKRHFVDSTQLETVSILKFIENRFGLPPLSQRDANANDLSSALR
jgi:phospholipase C